MAQIQNIYLFRPIIAYFYFTHHHVRSGVGQETLTLNMLHVTTVKHVSPFIKTTRALLLREPGLAAMWIDLCIIHHTSLSHSFPQRWDDSRWKKQDGTSLWLMVTCKDSLSPQGPCSPFTMESLLRGVWDFKWVVVKSGGVSWRSTTELSSSSKACAYLGTCFHKLCALHLLLKMMCVPVCACVFVIELRYLCMTVILICFRALHFNFNFIKAWHIFPAISVSQEEDDDITDGSFWIHYSTLITFSGSWCLDVLCVHFLEKLESDGSQESSVA